MRPTLLDTAALRRALTIRDLTDPAQGPHAMQAILAAIETALADAWRVPVRQHRAHPIVSVADNYDRLGYPPEAVTRDARYTRYVNPTTVLRGQTSAALPPLLEALAAEAARDGTLDLVLSCPGLVYRRDVIDRHHIGEPHQVDLWRIRVGAGQAGRGAGPGGDGAGQGSRAPTGVGQGNRAPAGVGQAAAGRPSLGPDDPDEGALDEGDLDEMIATVIAAALPGRAWRTIPASHPYTLAGREIQVANGGDWLEVGECGLANPRLLAECGLPPSASGLAMGLGLDRLLMLRKGIDDIRLLRATDPRIQGQMLDLAPYRPVSSMPPVRRDLSVAVAADATPEDLGDQVRAALGQQATAVESVEVVAETPLDELPETARERLGIRPGQKNVLLRVVLRDLERTLTDADANRLRDQIYVAVHAGGVHTWAGADASDGP